MDWRQAVLRGWKHRFWTNVATTAVLSLSFAVVSGLWLASLNVGGLMARWGDDIQLTVYIKDAATPEQVARIESSLKAQAAVQEVRFVSKEKATDVFVQSLASYGPGFIDSVVRQGENPFPASFFVSFKPEARDPERIQGVARGLAGADGVEDMAYGEEWVRNYRVILRVVRAVTLVLAVALLVGTLFTVGNAIRASLAGRREEIEILELVGATERAIRRPFVIEGAVQGFLGACLALGSLAAGFGALKSALARQVSTAGLSEALGFLPWYACLAVLAAGAAIGAVGSYLCVIRLNTGWAASAGEGPTP